ncbi:MAG TPA: carboxypeptidase regulatory-like domain-containing protein [Xanthobacteraceae bacterium]|nr:carboxypeptidase regulatory-like domain-containing protein [Xanthobacteraceae bacterium]
MKNLAHLLHGPLAFVIAFSGAMVIATSAPADEIILSGAVKSAAGEKLGGVMISAKEEGKTITTSIYTDDAGNYYFPPMPAGKYRVWAQALTFETAKSSVDLGAKKKQDFELKPMKDFVRQLPGHEMLAALPDDTPEDARMKVLVRKNCTGCHSASYPLQHRFDEQGWNAVIELMKQVNVLGSYFPPDQRKPNPNLTFHQKDIVAYLARVRGPGPSSMKFKLQPRPSGEAARAVFKEYDVPAEAGHGPPDGKFLNDGSDWSLGTPSGAHGASGVHDAQLDFEGNIWFTHSHASHEVTVGRIDGKSGAYKPIRLEDVKGFAVGTHGITRDQNGILWFNTRSNVQRGRGGLARLDPKTEKLDLFIPPTQMQGTQGTLDVTNDGKIWVTSSGGALLFDPAAQSFKEFKSPTHIEHGVSNTYGIAADRNGNGWWVQMRIDLVVKGDAATGKTIEFKVPPEKAAQATVSPEQAKMYETFVPPDFNTPFPWSQGPRRLGADKNGDFAWIGNSFGGNLAKINVNTNEMTLVPLPDPQSQQPYQVAVDKAHGVWTNLWSTDQIAKYDSIAEKWTIFDLPTRGTESRYISLLEQDGKLQVVVPYSRTRKVAVMTVRSEAEIQALKSRAEGQ